MKTTSLLLSALVLTCFFKGTAYSESSDIPFVWEGSISLVQTELMDPALGNVVTEWQLHPRFKEGARLDVKDDQGNLTGQFVRLEEAGSSWSGSTSGLVTSRCSSKSYEGSDGGNGDIITGGWGWIYYSMTDDDPLAEYLPNGYYSLSSNTGSTQKYPITVEITDTCRGGTHTMSRPAMLGFKINGDYYLEPFGAPGGTLPPFRSTADILGCITSGAMAALPKGWDSNPRILIDGTMSGSYSTTWARKIQRRGSWNISKVLDIIPVIEKPDEKWRPKGGKEENSLEVSARIADHPDLEGKWRFTLYDVSKEKGYCMNDGEGDEYDLLFQEGQAGFTAPRRTDDGWVIEGNQSVNNTRIIVQSLDYGAWGHLKAEVNVDGRWYAATVENGVEELSIPIDANDNHIADFWEESMGVNGEAAIADKDTEPAITGEMREPGDGFSNYEEYRGFMVGGVWEDTDPTYKDIFIYDELGYGVGYFEATELDIHLIDQDEYDADRVVNCKRGYGSITTQDGQKGLYLTEKNLGGYENNFIVSGMSTVGTPNVSEGVNINSVIIDEVEEAHSPDKYQEWLRSQGFQDWLIEEYMEEWHANHDYDSPQEGAISEGGAMVESVHRTLAHELGHGVNIPHHASFNKSVDEAVLSEQWGHRIAVQGGTWSGDVSCVMRYSCATEYLGIDGQLHKYPCDEVDKAAAISYCTAKSGTGINAGAKGTGDATEGECLKRLTLKGYFRNGQ